jgi:hypothetical protein
MPSLSTIAALSLAPQSLTPQLHERLNQVRALLVLHLLRLVFGFEAFEHFRQCFDGFIVLVLFAARNGDPVSSNFGVKAWHRERQIAAANAAMRLFLERVMLMSFYNFSTGDGCVELTLYLWKVPSTAGIPSSSPLPIDSNMALPVYPIGFIWNPFKRFIRISVSSKRKIAALPPVRERRQSQSVSSSHVLSISSPHEKLQSTAPKQRSWQWSTTSCRSSWKRC